MAQIHSVKMAHDRQAIGATMGRDVSRAQSLDEALRLGGLDWTVSKHNLRSHNNRKLSDVYGIYRDDLLAEGKDDEALISWAGKTYQPIQNLRQFQLIEEIVDSAEGANYENVGIVGNGAIVFAQVALPKLDFKVGGRDTHRSLLTSINPHKWGQTKQLFLTAIRIICQNTLMAAIREGNKLAKAGKAIKIHHSQKAEQRMDEAVVTLQGMQKATMTMQEKLDALAGRKATKSTVEKVAHAIFKPTKEDIKASKHEFGLKLKDAEVFEMILANFNSNDNNAFPEFRFTMYNLLNAVTEHFDHAATGLRRAGDMKNADTATIRANSAMFGDGAKVKDTVMELLLENAKTAPSHDFRKVYTTATRTNVLDDVLSIGVRN